MFARRLRFYLWLLGLLGLIGTGGALFWGTLWPCGNPPLMASAPARPKQQETAESQERLPPLASFSRLWTRPLRGPLFDPPPVQPEPVATRPRAVAKPLALTLVGTALEPDLAIAFIRNPTGNVELKRVGEFVGDRVTGAEVLTIQAEQVTVRYQGRKVTLKLPGKES